MKEGLIDELIDELNAYLDDIESEVAAVERRVKSMRALLRVAFN